jgi:hypothetical protein
MNGSRSRSRNRRGDLPARMVAVGIEAPRHHKSLAVLEFGEGLLDAPSSRLVPYPSVSKCGESRHSWQTFSVAFEATLAFVQEPGSSGLILASVGAGEDERAVLL